eukprot:2664730-Prymnesium_polylepis.1
MAERRPSGVASAERGLTLTPRRAAMRAPDQEDAIEKGRLKPLFNVCALNEVSARPPSFCDRIKRRGGGLQYQYHKNWGY